MENNEKMIESLLEKAVEYVKTSSELAKLKTIDKTSDIVSSYIPHFLVLVLICIFLVFFNMGLAIYIGEIIGKIFYGFFVIAAFYLITGIFVHFFMHKWLKKKVGNYIIKQFLK
jgi:hypothetical protein